MTSFNHHAELESYNDAMRERDLDGIVAWKPISEAPRDGRWIIALGTDNSVYRVSWGRNHNGQLAWCSVAGSFIGGYLTDWIEWPADNGAAARNERQS